MIVLCSRGPSSPAVPRGSPRPGRASGSRCPTGMPGPRWRARRRRRARQPDRRCWPRSVRSPRRRPTMRIRFFGFAAESSDPCAGGLRRPERVDGLHPRGHLGLLPGSRTRAPLACRDTSSSTPSPIFSDAHPFLGRAPCARLAPLAGSEQDGADAPPPRESSPPMNAGPLMRALGVVEHQHHGDDRHRAERHTDREREDLSDRFADAWQSLTVGGATGTRSPWGVHLV